MLAALFPAVAQEDVFEQQYYDDAHDETVSDYGPYDFGLAVIASAGANVSMTSNMSGTPSIMPWRNEVMLRVFVAISNPAASCMPIRKNSIAPMTVGGMLISTPTMEGKNAIAIMATPAGITV